MTNNKTFSALEQYATPKCTVIALDVQDVLCVSGYPTNTSESFVDFLSPTDSEWIDSWE